MVIAVRLSASLSQNCRQNRQYCFPTYFIQCRIIEHYYRPNNKLRRYYGTLSYLLQFKLSNLIDFYDVMLNPGGTPGRSFRRHFETVFHSFLF